MTPPLVRHYRSATCGSRFRLTRTPATGRAPATLTQERLRPGAAAYEAPYPTTEAEVARLVAFGSFVPEPPPP